VIDVFNMNCMYCDSRLAIGEKFLCEKCMADGRNIVKNAKRVRIECKGNQEDWYKNMDAHLEHMIRKIEVTLNRIEKLQKESVV